MMSVMGFSMFSIERKTGAIWQPEVQRTTEFRAYLDARTKCMVTGHTYRVVNREQEIEFVITLDDCRKHFIGD